MPEEDILSYIENKSVNPKTAKKKRNKKRKGKLNGEMQKNAPFKSPMEIPPLKGLKANPFTPDSSADRMTGTPHSKNGDTVPIMIKDEEEIKNNPMVFLVL